MNRMWVPGWQMLDSCFDEVKKQLKATNELTLSYLNEKTSVERWLDKTSAQITQPTQLVGWSLGGALAYLLASRNKWVESCLLINTNTQFSGANGLAPAVANAFMSRYQANPVATRKRFAALVDRARSEEVAMQLCQGDQLNTLQWLYDFNAANIKVEVPYHLLLSTQDQLVPLQKSAQAWQAQSATSITEIEAQHSAPLFAPEHLIQWIKSHE